MADCVLFEQVTTGDHDIVLLRVYDLGGDVNIAPLVFRASRTRRPER
ncbi:hypothetical protein [Micromonospora pisi]|nr:hypothetical protein [Micromonospora pisi]